MEMRVKTALEEGRIEDDIKDVRLEKVFGVSTKQAMIARVSSLHSASPCCSFSVAPTNPRPTHKPLPPFFTFRIQEQHPRFVPRNS